jgi:hypothetical protein
MILCNPIFEFLIQLPFRSVDRRRSCFSFTDKLSPFSDMEHRHLKCHETHGAGTAAGAASGRRGRHRAPIERSLFPASTSVFLTQKVDGLPWRVRRKMALVWKCGTLTTAARPKIVRPALPVVRVFPAKAYSPKLRDDVFSFWWDSLFSFTCFPWVRRVAHRRL